MQNNSVSYCPSSCKHRPDNLNISPLQVINNIILRRTYLCWANCTIDASYLTIKKTNIPTQHSTSQRHSDLRHSKNRDYAVCYNNHILSTSSCYIINIFNYFSKYFTINSYVDLVYQHLPLIWELRSEFDCFAHCIYCIFANLYHWYILLHLCIYMYSFEFLHVLLYYIC